MRVNHAFEFSDDTLRTIRAALGRGGAATRKECRVFIARAVEAALKAAPTPKPKRAKVAKVKADPMAVVAPPTETDEAALDRKRKAAIRKMYRTEWTEPV
jgi:hypothetical protein